MVAVTAASMGQDTVKPGASQQLLLALEQSQPAYSLRVPVELIYPDRSEHRLVDMARQRELAIIEASAAPTGVRVDPDLRLWRVLERDQLPPILRQWFISRTPRLVVASPSTALREAADALAQRLFETPPRPASMGDIGQGNTPVLLIGLHGDVDAAIAAANLPPRPGSLAGKGTAQAWTVIREGGAPLAIVSAQDADALRALLRPLPHYGAQSWVVFDGSKAISRGVWPAPGRVVRVGTRN
jgi:hypothetical protein